MIRLTAGAAVLAAALMLTGCDSVREASDTVGAATDKVSICAEALRLAGFNPDLGNPEQAAQDAKQKAEDLRELAGKTTDETLRDALNDMANKVGELGPEDVNPGKVTSWAAEKATRLEALTRACA